MLKFIRFSLCYALAGVLMLIVLVGLMFSHQYYLIDIWLLTGKPVAGWLLAGLPERFWLGLTGMPQAAEHPQVQSFLAFAVALAQAALLAALGFYRLWYRP